MGIIVYPSDLPNILNSFDKLSTIEFPSTIMYVSKYIN